MSSSVDKALWENFQQLSKKTRIPVSRLLDEAIEDSLKKYNQTQKSSN
ncbi:MAG TPA: ribbon-helix-helix domain-containing protein [Bacillota bacterium]